MRGLQLSGLSLRERIMTEIRAVFLKGNGILLLWSQMLSLRLLGVFVITASSSRFRKRFRMTHVCYKKRG